MSGKRGLSSFVQSIRRTVPINWTYPLFPEETR